VAVEGSGLRAVVAANLHLTLCFLGTVGADSADAIADAVVAAAGSLGGGSLGVGSVSLGGPVLLPARRPRVLAVELADPGGVLAALQSRVSAALAGGDWYQPEARPFLAHVTVARARRHERVRVDAAALPPLPSVAVLAPAVTLFRSRLGAGPGRAPRYEPLASVELY